ncbi:MAG: PAS domain-containing protein [Armatimonadetes bacterium]|jgi:two-component system phosphate regulon sensor histidine kinase PhoR|nr:PAS domain-containing protein [Armatimonadota bacterium]
MSEAVDAVNTAMKSLHRDKRRAELVLTEIADGIVCIDEDSRITLFNRAAETLFNRKAASVLGVNIDAADIHPELARLVAQCLTSRSPMNSEIRLPGLPERVIGVRGAPFSDSAHEAGVLLLLHDLSEIRRHEKMQKEFVSNISHELRTPITAIRTTAEALLAGAKNDADVVDRFLNTILSESDRLAALISDLMEIANRESGITVIERSEVDIGVVVERALVAIQPIADRNAVTLRSDAPKGLLAQADEVQITQLVRNLVDNAVKYSSEGGIVEVVATGSKDEITISVSDTGIGIPQGELGRIFDRFYRVDKARSRRMGGTGLGLAIVKDIVESHGGAITVDTQLGKGSTFTVVLPAKGHG